MSALSDPTLLDPEEVRGTVLIVDDDDDQRMMCRLFLEAEGYEVLDVSSTDDARALLLTQNIDAMILDVMMPKESGLDFLRSGFAQDRGLQVIMATASRQVEHAVFALKNGAFDYLVKPLSREDVLLAVRNAVERGQMSRELLARRTLELDRPVRSQEAIFVSVPMRLVLATLEKVKDASVPVMILGESGSGKEVVARWLHESSRRAKGPFVAVNCAALPKELVESELFGHEKGAFTGAEQRRAGRFEEASSGTLFLDEIGEMPLPVQAKLLRVLEDGIVHRVGGGQVSVDTRVVTATHRDLLREVREGRFREDLYYRLEVITVSLPPLRERLEEIPLLAEHLLGRFVAKEGLEPRRLSPSAIKALQARAWPGNVRELQNVLKRSALLSEGPVIEEAQLAFKPESLSSAEPIAELSIDRGLLTAEAQERERMLRALAETRGNVSAAARVLGIGRSTFYRRAKQFALPI